MWYNHPIKLCGGKEEGNLKKRAAKMVSIIMTAAMLLTTPLAAQAAWSNPFTDVKPSAWYYEAAEYVNTNDLFSGTAVDQFSPETPMSRGMFVTVLGKFQQVDTNDYPQVSFSDVKGSDYYAPYVEWAAKNKVVSGIGGGKFAPNSSITREQMATMFYKYAQLVGADTTFDSTKLLSFPDGTKTSDYAQQAMAWAVTHGVLAGSDGNLLPQGTATRAQTAQIFYNARELLATQVEQPQREKIWVVDKPGHYETVEHWELVPVTVGEVGHWEDVFYTHWVYQCNTCGYRTDTVEEINRHIENSITWVNNKPVGCAGYSMVSSDPEYTGEQYWVVDVPGHIEYQWQAVKEEIWVEEVGHWEYL